MTPHWQCKQRWRYAGVVLLVTWSLVAIGFLSPQVRHWMRREEKDEHTIPTVLSVVDKTGRYVYALDNPLYEKLMSGTFLPKYEREDILEAPELQLDRTNIQHRDSLHLSWTLGRRTTGEPVIDDSDVFILYCDEQGRMDSSSRNLLDAATVRQAKATSKKHRETEFGQSDYLADDEATTWYFPSFPVVRHEVCQFELYKGLPGNSFSLLSSSELLHITNGMTVPTGIHLALGNDPSEMIVQFKTGIGGTPIVKYGLSEDSLTRTSTGKSHTYSADDMCQEPATEKCPGKFLPPGQLHVVRLANLASNTTYHYQVGVEANTNGAITTWSKPFSFVSAPEVKANSGSFSFIVYGDQGCPSLGWGDGGKWTAAMTSREVDGGTNSLPIRAVHHFGDLSYARGAAHIWDEWLNMISPFTTRVPLMISAGNHEYDHTEGGENGKDPSGVPTPGGYKPKWGNYGTDSGGECGVPMANHFTMPNSTKTNGVFWYSFDFGNVHTTVISAEHDLSPGSAQYEWLEDDLMSVDRTRLPWLVLELHRPMYDSMTHLSPNNKVGIEVRKRIEHLLKIYQVDLVLAGHLHLYERSCSGLYKSQCNNGGPTHVTVGSAGALLTPNLNPLKPRKKWMKKTVHGSWGYGRVTVANATALHFEFIKAGGACDKNVGRVLDEIWLLKGRMGSHLYSDTNVPSMLEATAVAY